MFDLPLSFSPIPSRFDYDVDEIFPIFSLRLPGLSLRVVVVTLVPSVRPLSCFPQFLLADLPFSSVLRLSSALILFAACRGEITTAARDGDPCAGDQQPCAHTLG